VEDIMRTSSTTKVIAVLGSVCLALAACATDGDSASGDGGDADSGLVIGMQTDYSGDEGVYGVPGVNAAKLAVKHLNEAGGILGKPVELVVGDAASQPQQALAESQRMVDVNGASAIVTLGTSGECLSIEEGLTIPRKIPTLGTACVSPAHTANQSSNQGYFFRVRNSVQSLVGPAVKMLGHDGVKKICALYVDNAYGQGANEYAQKILSKFAPGAQMRSVSTPVDTVPSRLAETQKCTADGYDTMLLMVYGIGQGDEIIKDALQNNLAKKFYMLEDLESTQIYKGVGWKPLDGAAGFSGAASPGPNLEAYQNAYQEAYGGLSDVPLVEYNYDAVMLAALAAQKAQSTDGTKIRDALFEIANGPGVEIGVGPDAIKAALDAIKAGDAIDYVGLAGVQFAPNGEEEVSSAKVWHVDAGKQSLPTDGYVTFDAGQQSFTYKPEPSCLYCSPSLFE
jgi:branched-chain amino acid transport system substrate-binding protein